MKKYDKSLVEVWEWKNKTYNDLKNLSTKKYIEKIKNNAEKILKDYQISLKTLSLKEK